MEHKFRDILERDMDMLILEEFSCSNEFSRIFLDKIGIKNARLTATWQSKTDGELGESDMTVVFDCGEKKVALLIEDKIDAIAMPEQPTRYTLRGNKGIIDGEYDIFFIFIVAPQEYLEKNEKAKEYPNCVSYEEIKSYFERLGGTRGDFKLAQLTMAIDKQKKGYQVVKNSLVTDFWNKYVMYKNQFFPVLNLAVHGDIKPTNGIWPHFRTNVIGTFIYHKSNKGYVDLTFNGQAEKITEIKKFVVDTIGDFYEKGFSIVKTGKSCAIRRLVPILFFTKPFEIQIDLIKPSFEAVEELYKLSMRLEIAGIYDMLK